MGAQDAWYETVTRLAREWVTHALALGLFGVFLALLVGVLWAPDKEAIGFGRDIAEILGALVGIVFGFYFGERSGSSRAAAATAEAKAKTNEASKDLGRLLATAEHQLEQQKVEHAQRIREIQQLLNVRPSQQRTPQ